MGSCAALSAALPAGTDLVGLGSAALSLVGTVTGIGASIITIAGALPH
ncbi:hypothetical protein [Nocardia stercoris]|nr:hypothetical protein [Nocardia stercoris]